MSKAFCAKNRQKSPKIPFFKNVIHVIVEGASETNREEFLREIRLMKGIGYHRNVISMLGCCTLRDPICLVVEHASDGDLLSYLRDTRKNVQQVLYQSVILIKRIGLSAEHLLTSHDNMGVNVKTSKNIEFIEIGKYIKAYVEDIS